MLLQHHTPTTPLNGPTTPHSPTTPSHNAPTTPQAPTTPHASSTGNLSCTMLALKKCAYKYVHQACSNFKLKSEL